jgi:hypothetical protein
MKMFKRNLLALVLFSAALVSCGGDDSSNGGETSIGDKYVLGYMTDTWDANYIWKFDSLEQLMTGEISMVGQGIEQAGSYIPVGNSLFACATNDDGAIPYNLNSASQLVAGNPLFIESNYAYGLTDDGKAVIIGASWEGASDENEILIYDPATGSIINRKFDNFGTAEGRFDWPTAVTVSGSKLFVTVFNRDASESWNMTQDKTWVRVYEYPSLTYIKTIEDTRSTAAGMYYTNTGMIRTDSGDIYTFSSNSKAAGFIPTEGHSGILRIKDGQTEFDASYFVDFEATYGKVLAAYPAGGERAYVVYLSAGDDDVEWGFLFDNYKFKSAIIDLPSKAVTQVTGLPAHGGDYYFGVGSLYVENGKAYKAFKTNTETRIYRIDLATGAATPGALVTGGGTDISVITKLSPKSN